MPTAQPGLALAHGLCLAPLRLRAVKVQLATQSRSGDAPVVGKPLTVAQGIGKTSGGKNTAGVRAAAEGHSHPGAVALIAGTG